MTVLTPVIMFLATVADWLPGVIFHIVPQDIFKVIFSISI